MSIKNIWKNITKNKNGEYFLKDDEVFLTTFNEYNNNESYSFNLKVSPEPRLGNIDSKIFILSGNPYIKVDTDITHKERLNSLKNHNSNHLCLQKNDIWWTPRFKEWAKFLEKENNIDESNAFFLLSENICSVEFFPYSSANSGFNNLRLPSQEYQKEIVYNAIRNEASFVFTRNYYNWIGLVPELYNYKNTYHLSSSQSSYFTQKNLLNHEEYKEKLKKDRHIDDIRKERDKNYNPIREILKGAGVI